MSSRCAKCQKAVYPQDPSISLDGTRFHKACAKCADCSTQITLSNFTKSPDNTLLCKVHYFKRFREEGNYVGGEQFQRKGTADLRKELRSPSEVGSSNHGGDAMLSSPTFRSPGVLSPSVASPSMLSPSVYYSPSVLSPSVLSPSITSVSTTGTSSGGGSSRVVTGADIKLGRSASGSEDVESTRPVSERVVVERPALGAEDLKARRATFGGVKAQQLKLTPATSGGGSNKCPVCSKSVFPNDPQISLDGTKFHKACAKCADCGTQITLSNFTKSPDNTLLCKTHYFKRFREEGNYVGGEQFQRKGTAEARADLRKLSSMGSGMMADGAGGDVSSPTISSPTISSPNSAAAEDQAPPPSPPPAQASSSSASPPPPPTAAMAEAAIITA